MPTFLPLDLVLLVVRHAVARTCDDEDWFTHHRRVSHLCLVCKDFREEVHLVLCRPLTVWWLEDFHKFAGRSGRDRHLLEHVEELRAGDPERYDRPCGGNEAPFVLRYYLPNLRIYRSRSFGGEKLSMEAFAMYDRAYTASVALRPFLLTC